MNNPIEGAKAANQEKLDIELETLTEIANLLSSKTSDYGPVAEVIDFVMEVTGYDSAQIPGGETQVAGRLVAKVVRYMELRVQHIDGKAPNHEPLKDTLDDIIGEAVRLKGEAQFNMKG